MQLGKSFAAMGAAGTRIAGDGGARVDRGHRLHLDDAAVRGLARTSSWTQGTRNPDASHGTRAGGAIGSDDYDRSLRFPKSMK